jgi:hypothetical protein
MSVIFMDGFDYYPASAIFRRWTSLLGVNAFIALGQSFGRHSGGQGASPYATTGSSTLVKSLAANYAQGVLGFAFEPYTAIGASRTLAIVYDGASEQISIRTDSSSRLIVCKNGTPIGSSNGGLLSVGVYYYIELKFVIAGGTSGSFDLHVNGSSVLSASGVNTQQTANAYMNGFGLVSGTINATNSLFDDVYFVDTSASIISGDNDFLGNRAVIAIYPAAPGAHSQWTPSAGTNFSAVSEPVEDEDVSFVQSTTAGQYDTYVYEKVPYSAGGIMAIQHCLTVRQDPGAQRVIKPVQRSGGTDYDGTAFNPASTYSVNTQIIEANPADSSNPYTIATLNASEFGVKLDS